jgi:hypothetical protein
MTRDDLVRDATQLVGRQVQQLAGRTAIKDLVNRLGVWLDEKRFDEARSIFTENVAVDTPGGPCKASTPWVERASRDHEDRTQHVITNVLVDLARWRRRGDRQ